MESPAQRDERVTRLERERDRRRSGPTDDGAVEIAPGRGDLRYSSQPLIGPPDELWSSFVFGNNTVSYARIFQTQPWVAAAVMRMLTWSVRIPLKVYQRLDDDSRRRLRPEDHPLAEAVVHPYDRGSQAQLTMDLLGPVLVHGNSVTEILEGANERIQFQAKDWRFATPIRPWRDSLEGFKVDGDSNEFRRDVSIDQLLHVAWWSPAGPIGTSPLQQLGVTLRQENAAQRYQAGMLNNAARPPSAITASDEFLGLERDERRQIMQQLREDVTTIYAGPDNAGKPALLPPGLDWKPIGHSAVEAELIDQRKIARDEIASVYMIPPPMMGILDKATYSNIETQREMIYTESVGPPLVLIEQLINAQVVRDMLRADDLYVEYDFAGVLRGDRLKEIQGLREAISTALMTPNEGRSVLNMQRSDAPEMDDFYLPFNNLAPVGSPPPQSQPPNTSTSSRRLQGVFRD